MAKLSHLDENGVCRMVNVGEKNTTRRVAVAQSLVLLNAETLALLVKGNLPKGDALSCARIGAILAAKRTAELIPLCHTLPLSFVDVAFEIIQSPPSIKITTEARCSGQTGVEMEAIVAAQTAAAIIYDMAKAVQRDIVITDTRLLYKNGGKSGEFRSPGYSGQPESC